MRRRSVLGLAAVVTAAASAAPPAGAYQVLVDLNTYAKGREGGDDPTTGAVARTAAFAGADGVWLVTDSSGGDKQNASGIATTTAAGFTLAQWRQMVTNIGGPSALLSTEDNPPPGAAGAGPHPSNQSYNDAKTLVGTGGATAFSLLDGLTYNETGIDPAGGTVLSDAQISAEAAKHGGTVAVLTRSYQNGGTNGNWKAETDRALANPLVSAVAMETTDLPGQRTADFVKASLAAGKRAYVYLTPQNTARDIPGLYLLKQQAPQQLATGNVRFMVNNGYLTTNTAGAGTDGYAFYGTGDTVQAAAATAEALKLAVPVETWNWTTTAATANWSTRSNWTVGPVANPLTAAGATEASPGQTYDAASFGGTTGAAQTVAVDTATARVTAVYFGGTNSYAVAGPQAVTLAAYGVIAGGSDGRVPCTAGAIPTAAADATNSYGPGVVPIAVAGTGTHTITATLSVDATTAAAGLVIDDRQTGGDFTVGGTIATAGVPVAVQGVGSVRLTGPITGGPTLTMNGTGPLALGGTASNAGLTLVAHAGRTYLNAAGTAYAADAVADIAAGAVVRPLGTSAAQLNPAYAGANLTINAGGTFDLYGADTSLTAVAGTSGNLTNSGGNAGATTDATLTVGVGNRSATFAGSISDGTDGLAVVKVGTGTQTLTGVNPFTGGTTIAAGTLALAGGANRLAPASTVAFAGGILSLGGTAQTLAGLTVADNATGTVAGNGTLTYTGPSLGGTNATLNLAAAGAFASAGLNVNGARYTLQLPAVATVTGPSLAVGTGNYAASTTTSTTLLLGQTNTFNVDAVQIGNYHADGAVDGGAVSFVPATFTLRGQAGGASRTPTVGVGVNSAGPQSQTGTLDLAGLVVDARVGAMTVGSYAPSSGNAATAGTFNLSTGTLDATSLTLAAARPTNTTGGAGTVVGTVNQTGGTVRAGTLTLGAIGTVAQGTTAVTATYNLAGGTLAATTITAGLANANLTATRTLAVNGGTVANLNDGAGTVTDLTVAGSAAAANGVLNVVLGPGGATVAADAGRTVTVAATAPISGNGTLTKTGGGTLALAGVETVTGATAVSAGTLVLAAGASLATSPVTVGGTFEWAAGTVLAPRNLAGLTLLAGGRAVVDAPPAPPARQVVVTPTLAIAGGPGNWTGLLDLTGNDLAVTAGSLAAVTSQAAQGFAGGTWAGTGGITSATAAADARHLTAVGVIANGSTYATFDGQPVPAAAVLARLTYYGDANLDGVVNAADYSRLDAGAVNRLTGWANGDFNYDGVVDGSDYALADNAFNAQAGGIARPAAAVAAVPEPACLAAAAVAGLLGGRRRRRTVTGGPTARPA